jgi:Leucine-rich repeat (LRR) protein
MDKVKDLTELICKSVGGLKNLKYLDFSRNNITDSNIIHVAEMV